MQSRKETNLRGSCDSSRASLSAHAMSMHSGCQIMRWACVEYRSHAAVTALAFPHIDPRLEGPPAEQKHQGLIHNCPAIDATKKNLMACVSCCISCSIASSVEKLRLLLHSTVITTSTFQGLQVARSAITSRVFEESTRANLCCQLLCTFTSRKVRLLL
eukprot:1150340-Pelagomonas_calceolata.AAC.9